MTDQLQLVEVPAEVQLTDRQQAAYDAITAAGYEGLHTDEVGAAVHAWQGRHNDGDRCQFCGSTGQELGKALRAKGKVQQRRRRLAGGDQVTVWTVAGKIEKQPVETTGVPYNEFPAGF